MKKAKQKKCVLKTCDNPVFAKGLCRQHYYIAYRRIASGDWTWDLLYKRGQAEPDKRRTSKDFE